MTGRERKRRLARERYERNLQRRARTRRRKRFLVIGAVTAAALVGGASALVGTVGLPSAAGEPGGGASTPGDAARADATGSPQAAGAPSCSYERLPQARRGDAHTFVGMPPASPEPGEKHRARVETNRGPIVIDLLNGRAPCAVNSFRFLADNDFYRDTSCHRLVTTGIHILQCGDPSGTGKGGPGYSFADENLEGTSYPRGTVAMANSGPDTNGSQFFVVYDKGGLEPDFTPFGRVVRGLDIVEDVAEAGTAGDGVAPKKEVVIQDVSVTQVS